MHWNIALPTSLKTRITLSTLLIFLLAILAMVFYTGRMLREDMQHLLGDQQLSTVTLVAASINAEMERRVKALETVAAGIDSSMLENPATVQKFLEQSLALPILFNEGVHVVGRNGMALADVSELHRIGHDYSDNDAVQAVLSDKDGSRIGRPLMGLLKHPVFPIAIALHDAHGKVIGALIGTTNLGKPNFLDAVTEGHYGKTGNYLILSPQYRLVVTSSDKRRIMEALPGPGVDPITDRFISGDQAPAVFFNRRNVEMMAAAKRIPVANWNLVIALPGEEAFAPIRMMRQRMLLATLCLSVLAGGLMWWILQRHLAPLAFAASKLAAQRDVNQGLQPLSIVRQDEIGQLIGGFNGLLDTLKQRDAALQESEKRYRMLVETSSALIWSVDVEGRWTFVNQVCKSIYGYMPEEMLGRPFTDFEMPGQAQQDLEVFAKIKAGQPAWHYRTTHLRKDDAPVILDFNAIAMHDASGNVIGTTGTATDVTQLVHSEKDRQESMARLRMMTEQLRISLWTTDGQFRILTCSCAGLLATGLPREQVVGHTLFECYYFDSDLIVKAKQVFTAKEGVTIEEIGVGGHIFMTRIDPLHDAQGEVTGLIGMSFDVTEQKRYEAALFAEKERSQVTLNSIGDAVITTDLAAKVSYLNPVAETLTGWQMAEAAGLPLLEVFQPRDEESGEIMFDPIDLILHQGGVSKLLGPNILRRRNGCVLSIQYNCAAIMGRDGKVIGMVLVFHDVSETRKLTAQLAYQATHDALTKLPNRLLLGDRLVQAIAYAEREHGQVALLFLDLDRFKNVNDSLGHAVGDQLLQMVAERLNSCVRRADTVCRLGGDEFVVLLTVARIERIIDVAQSVFAVLGKPFLVDQNVISITGSIGIAVYPFDGTEFEELSRNADLAMYHAKEQGRNNYQFYKEEMNVKAMARLAIENGLRRALDEGQLLVYYQPQMNLDSGLMIGAEALLRWRDPERGLILPTTFISIAEECGLILAIGKWVLNEVCRQNRAWQDAGLAAVKISVNCSPFQFRDSSLLKNVEDALARYDIAPVQLELELTESTVMQDAETGILVLNGLKNIGVSLSIDDFGTGYSSLSYLKQFPVNALKIDQSFVRDITTNPDGAAIAMTIVNLGHSLRLAVIAEGVENIETLNFLHAHQCDDIQGNYISHPLPADEFEAFMRKTLGEDKHHSGAAPGVPGARKRSI